MLAKQRARHAAGGGTAEGKEAYPEGKESGGFGPGGLGSRRVVRAPAQADDASAAAAIRRARTKASEPKVFVPHHRVPGTAPRKLEVERRRREFAGMDLESLLQEQGVDYSKSGAGRGDGKNSPLPLEAFDCSGERGWSAYRHRHRHRHRLCLPMPPCLHHSVLPRLCMYLVIYCVLYSEPIMNHAACLNLHPRISACFIPADFESREPEEWARLGRAAAAAATAEQAPLQAEDLDEDGDEAEAAERAGQRAAADALAQEDEGERVDAGPAGVPARAVVRGPDGTGVYERALVRAYLRHADAFEVQLLGVNGGDAIGAGTEGAGIVELPRVDICFDGEDPRIYAARVGFAHRARDEAGLLLRYHLYVDCMPTEDMPGLAAQ